MSYEFDSSWEKYDKQRFLLKESNIAVLYIREKMYS